MAIAGASHRGASHTVPKLSFWERLLLVSSLARIAATVIPVVIFKVISTSAFSRRCLRRCILRAVATRVATLPLRQTQFVLPTTGDTVSKYCKSQHLSHEAVIIEPGADFPPATLHFVGCEPEHADILLYFHGGGYTFAASPDHPPFAHQAAQAAKSGLCFLEYGLTPEVPYPGQLAQTAAALRYLLQARPASQIIVGGDSAGGAMTLALIAHLRSPQPQVPALDLPEGAKLKGALCISSRCGTGFKTASYEYNADKDILDIQSLHMFMARWQATPGQVWCAPIRGEAEFWAKSKEERIILLVGGDELFLEENRDFARHIGAKEQSGIDRQLVVCPNEIHVQCIFDAGMGLTDGKMYSAAMSWLSTL